MMRSLALCLFLAGCPKGGDADKDGTTDDTAGGGDTDSGTGGGDADVAPTITSVDLVDCTAQQSAGEVWSLQLTVNDPQGIDTVRSGTATILNESGGTLDEEVLACNDGTCIGSFRADLTAVSCSLDGSISFVFQVEDEDGNLSDTRTYDTAAGG